MMEDLIEQLRNLTAPDTRLDCKIREAVEGWKNIGGGWREWPDGRRETYDYGFARPYTASIDAALTLIPDGWPIERLSWWPRVAEGHDDQRCCSLTVLALTPDGFGDPGKRFDAIAATPALAVCIAALKARDNRLLSGRMSGE